MNLFYKTINSKNWLKKLFLLKGFTTFRVKSEPDTFAWSNRYRFTGFYYIYDFKGSCDRKIQPCNRKYGNAAGGTGVCGWYEKFENIEITRIKFTKAKFTCRKYDGHNRFVKRNEREFNFLYEMPTGLTNEEYSKMAINMAVESAMKSFKNK